MDRGGAWGTGLRTFLLFLSSFSVVHQHLQENPRRFTWSALKQKEEEVHVVSSESHKIADKETALQVYTNGTGTVTTNGTQAENLQLVQLSQNASFMVPKTVKEFFQAGLLEGHTVYYNGGNKGPTLRGKIQDTGILCSCRECKRVIQFRFCYSSNVVIDFRICINTVSVQISGLHCTREHKIIITLEIDIENRSNQCKGRFM